MIVTSSPTLHPGVWTQPETSTTGEINHIQTQFSCSVGDEELKSMSAELASLSHQGRWIVLINPQSQSYKSILAQSGIKMERVLLVHTKDDIEALWTLEKAITNGTSSAAICWVSSLDERDLRRLQLVNKSARAKGIILQSAPNSIAISPSVSHPKLSFH